VGLHGLTHKGNLFRSRRVFEKQKQNINQILQDWKAVGFRAPSMYHHLEWTGELDIAYDMSTFDTDPFEPQPDGTGTIFPYWVSATRNPHPETAIRFKQPNDQKDQQTQQTQRTQQTQETQETRGFVELPCTLPQDHTLFIILQEKDNGIWKQKLDWIAAKGGMALFTVHPDYLVLDSQPQTKYKYPVRLYEDLLAHIKTRYKGEYWNGLPKELAEFWKEGYQKEREITIPTPVADNTFFPREDKQVVSSMESTSKKKVIQSSPRICFIYYAWFNGSAVLYREAKALQDKGFEVDIICLRDSKSEPKFWVYHGLNIYGIQARPKREKKTIIYFSRLGIFCLKSMFLLSWWAISRRYKIIHVTTPPDFLVFAGLFPKILGAKIIMDIHDIGPELYMRKLDVPENAGIVRFLRKMEKISARFADHVITVTDIWRDKLIQRSVNPSKCTVLMNVPDEKLFCSEPVSNFKKTETQPFNIFYHGSLEEHFGVDTLLEAMPLIKEKVPLARLTIYGTGRLAEDFKKMVREKEMEGYVRFGGMVSFYQLPEILRDADLGVVPTKDSTFSDEALSMKSLEYIALGIPIVISGTKVHRYYYNENMVAFFKPGQARDLAERVIWLAGNRERCAEQVDNGQVFIQQRGWGTSKEKYYQVVDDLIGESRH
jgi:glycosyltransferase involved in cell wall biosynthesis